MATTWSWVPVSKVATPVIGGTPNRNNPAFWNGNIPWATARDVAAVSGRYLVQVQEFITEEGLNHSAAKLLPKGTVIITARGTVGAIAQLGRAMAFNQTSYALLPAENLDNDFLFYALKGTLAEMQTLTYGTVFKTITTRTFDHWLIPLPPLPEQRAIAHILSTLDDKIELLRRMSETLEEMARAIFKAWFVDFVPVRAKMEGRWKRGQSLPGLPAHLYDLFPDRLVPSELGEIPKGWRVGIIGEEVDLIKGVSYRSKDLGDSNVALVTLKSFKRGGGYRTDGLKPYVGPYKPEQVAHPGELILSQTDVTQSAEVIGKPAIVLPDDRFQTLVASLDVLIVRPRHRVLSREFFYLLFSTPYFQEHIYGYTNGTTVLHLNKEGVLSFRFVQPTEDVAIAFSKIVVPMFTRFIKTITESRTLAALRDALLPKLVSGAIRVKDVKRFAQEKRT